MSPTPITTAGRPDCVTSSAKHAIEASNGVRLSRTAGPTMIGVSLGASFCICGMVVQAVVPAISAIRLAARNVEDILVMRFPGLAVRVGSVHRAEGAGMAAADVRALRS